MPSIVYEIISVFSSLLRLLGMAALGVALGWLSLDLFRKAQSWFMEAVLFLGLIGLIIALVVFLSWGALGAFGIGLAVAIFLWGMPRKIKTEVEKP